MESKAWKYTVGLQAAYQRENVPCKGRAEESISCLWQMWCAWSEPLIKYWQPAWGSSVKWRRACRAPSKWHLGGKKQWKECLWYWNNFTYIYSKRLEVYIDLSRSWCWGGVKSAFHVALSSLIYAGHLTTTQFKNLSEPSCLPLKQSKWALKTKPHTKTTTKKLNPALNLENSAHLVMLIFVMCVQMST